MKNSLCKSSIEAHIEHCVASTFSSIPKAYSSNRIEQYLKLHKMFLNGISILSYYLQTFNNNDDFFYNNKEKELDLSMFENSNSNVSILYTVNNLNTTLSEIDILVVYSGKFILCRVAFQWTIMYLSSY